MTGGARSQLPNLQRFFRVIVALENGHPIAPEDAQSHAQGLKLFISGKISPARCFGLPDDFRSIRERAIRDHAYLELAASFEGTTRQKAEKLNTHLRNHPKLRPPGPSLGFESIRKLLAGQNASRSKSPTTVKRSRHAAQKTKTRT